MIKKLVYVVILGGLCLAAGPALAERELVNPNEPGDLRVVVAIADSPSYIEEWMNTPGMHRPVLQRLDSARIGQVLHIAFVVTGYSSNDNLSHDFTVGFRIINPDGSVLFDQPDYAGGRSTRSCGPGFIMANPALDLGFEPGDQIGTYTIEVTVKDVIAGKEARTTHEIEIRAGA